MANWLGFGKKNKPEKLKSDQTLLGGGYSVDADKVMRQVQGKQEEKPQPQPKPEKTKPVEPVSKAELKANADALIKTLQAIALMKNKKKVSK